MDSLPGNWFGADSQSRDTVPGLLCVSYYMAGSSPVCSRVHATQHLLALADRGNVLLLRGLIFRWFALPLRMFRLPHLAGG
jgi:hypothetical protein